ncbi:unnamed protein product [Protopolystoma xenopodis]|uniref:Uncharacterized protein n=1 Tax=Protopolystoma xenopodis TaxID=117903 RepID=A0A448XRZ1_9PLAT|nr:unnamed protein product [Protopolystoma xenopodis]
MLPTTTSVCTFVRGLSGFNRLSAQPVTYQRREDVCSNRGREELLPTRPDRVDVIAGSCWLEYTLAHRLGPKTTWEGGFW